MYPLFFFYLCDGFYNRGINHLSFSRGSLRAHTMMHNIVWRYTYSIRLFLIEAKHRYRGKNINRKHTL